MELTEAHQKWNNDQGDKTLRLDYDLNPQSIVIDAGGYKGQWAQDIYDKYQCRIVIYEPVKSFFEDIEKRFEKNEKVLVINKGLGGSTRDEMISIDGDAASIFQGEGTEKISIADVDTIEFKVDLIKINIEAGEYELLERLIETDRIKQFKDIQVQFHNFLPEAEERRDKIVENLLETHNTTYEYDWIWSNFRIK